MRLLEYQGLRGPQHSAPQHSPLPTQGVALQTQDAAQGSPRCLQTSVLCLPACLPPGCARRALGRQARSAPPGTNAKGTGVAASPVFTYPAAPEPRPGQGLLGSAGPSRPPRAPSLPGWWWWWGPTEKKGPRPQSCGAPAAAAVPGRSVRPGPRAGAGGPLSGASRRAPHRGAPHSPPLHGFVPQPQASSSAGLRRRRRRRREASHSGGGCGRCGGG